MGYQAGSVRAHYARQVGPSGSLRLIILRDPKSELSVPLTLSFRRFYFDGLAVGKFEVGITTKSSVTKNLSRKQTRDFIHHCLNLPVTIPALSYKAVSTDFADKKVETVLGTVSKPLARFYAGSSISHPPPIMLEDWWVLPGAPLLFLVHKSSERIHIPFLGQSIPRSENLECDLSYCEVPYAGKTLRMWVMGLSPYTNYRDVRSLRICLLRLHAEHESMRLILQNIATNKIDIIPRTNVSNTCSSPRWGYRRHTELSNAGTCTIRGQHHPGSARRPG